MGVVACDDPGREKPASAFVPATQTYAAWRSLGPVGLGTLNQVERWNSSTDCQTSSPWMVPKSVPAKWPPDGGSPMPQDGSGCRSRYAVTVSTGTATNVMG